MNNGKDKTIIINEDRIIKRDKKLDIILIEIKQNIDDIDCHIICLPYTPKIVNQSWYINFLILFLIFSLLLSEKNIFPIQNLFNEIYHKYVKNGHFLLNFTFLLIIILLK